jgi:hypothetical protein
MALKFQDVDPGAPISSEVNTVSLYWVMVFPACRWVPTSVPLIVTCALAAPDRSASAEAKTITLFGIFMLPPSVRVNI